MQRLLKAFRPFPLAEYEVSELPFWRSSASEVRTSDLVAKIHGFRERYGQLDESALKSKSYEPRALAAYLFQVNHIEGEGFETFEETAEAIANGALELGDAVQADRRLEAVRCLHRGLRVFFPSGKDEEEADDVIGSKLSVRKIVEAHSELMRSTNPEIAGMLRRYPSHLVMTRTQSGGIHVFMWPTEVEGALEKLANRSRAELAELLERDDADPSADTVDKILKFGARLFLEFEHIHPFLDGNGRIGRILLAAVLRRVMPFPNVLFAAEGSSIDPPFVRKDHYYECFERAQGKQEFFSGGGKVAISQKAVAATKVYPPVDLAAMVVEGVYVGWKRFFDAQSRHDRVE